MTSMTRIATAAAMTLAAGSAALAADLPTRMAPPAPYVAPVPVFTWTGPYFGINAGYAFSNREKFSGPAGNPIFGGASASDDGFSAGAQIGYNWQLPGFGGFGGPGNGVVLGFEADAMYMDTDRSVTTVNGVNSTSFRSGLDFLGTARGRIGYAFNQFMIYGTGGFAYGDVNSRIVNTASGVTNYIGSSSGFNTGYAYGGGIEYAIPTNSFLNFFHSSAVTLKAEYLHYDLDSSNLQDSDLNTVSLANGAKVKNSGNLARIGLNYKF